MTGEIILGCKARDRVSGFEGTVTSRKVWADGSVQFGIQPRVSKEKPDAHPDGIAFDAAQLEFVGGVDSGLKPQAYLDTVKVAVGELVEDVVTAYRGVALIRIDFLNGCVYFHVQGKPTKKGDKPPKPEFIEHFRLKKVGAGISKSLPKPVKASEVKAPERAGGPPTTVDYR